MYLTALSSQKPAPSPPPILHCIPQGLLPRPSPPLLSHHLSLSYQLPRVRDSSHPPAACLLSAWASPALKCVCACVHVCECLCKGRRLGARLPLFLPQEPTLARPALRVPSPAPLPPGLAVLVSPCISLFSPLSLCPSSDLDRDFWNNNESTVQQKWSSYPPKEFILNISPYAPYGDPRLSLK